MAGENKHPGWVRQFFQFPADLDPVHLGGEVEGQDHQVWAGLTRQAQDLLAVSALADDPHPSIVQELPKPHARDGMPVRYDYSPAKKRFADATPPDHGASSPFPFREASPSPSSTCSAARLPPSKEAHGFAYALASQRGRLSRSA